MTGRQLLLASVHRDTHEHAHVVYSDRGETLPEREPTEARYNSLKRGALGGSTAPRYHIIALIQLIVRELIDHGHFGSSILA